MAEIIFASDEGVIFEKTIDKNKRCKVVVKHKDRGNAFNSYRFKDAPGLDSPYINWENLNCCGGWVYDKNYLYTAVQRGKKLFSAISLSFSDEAGELSVSDKITGIKNELPDDCVMGHQEPFETRNGPYTFRHYFICKTGAISDHINIDDVLAAYARLGILIDAGLTDNIKEYCGKPLEMFAKLSAPVKYMDAPTGLDLIIAGLLLGYPLESTAWLIENDKLLPVS